MGVRLHLLDELDVSPGQCRVQPQHHPHDRPAEQTHARQDRDGIAWQADDYYAVPMTTHQDRSARLNGGAVQGDDDLVRPELLGKVVAFPGTDPADGDDQIGLLQGCRNSLGRRLGVVGDVLVFDWFGPDAAKQLADHGSIGVADLMVCDRLSSRPHLIAGGQHRRRRRARHHQMRLAGGGCDAQVLGSQHGTGRDQRVAPPGVRPARVNGLAPLDRVDGESNRIAAIALLMGDDRIHIVRQRCAGGNGHTMPRGHRYISRLPCVDGRLHRKSLDPPDLLGTQRIAVHLRAIERRQIAIGDDRLAQHTSAGRGQLDTRRSPQRFDPPQRPAQGVGIIRQRGHGRPASPGDSLIGAKKRVS